MSLSLAHLDLTQIFCDVDDFCREFERRCERALPRLPCNGQPKGYPSRSSISAVMTSVIAFHGSGYRTFKDFYKQKVRADWRDAFPRLFGQLRTVRRTDALDCYGLSGLSEHLLFGRGDRHRFHLRRVAGRCPNTRQYRHPQATF